MCLAGHTLSCKAAHVQAIQGHVYSGRESLTVFPLNPPVHVVQYYVDCWIWRDHYQPCPSTAEKSMNDLYVEVRSVTSRGTIFKRNFGKNVPVVSAVTVQQPARLTNKGVGFRQQQTEILRPNPNSVQWLFDNTKSRVCLGLRLQYVVTNHYSTV